MEKPALFTMGKITGVHGLKGNLKVWSFAKSIETFSPGSKVFIKSPKESKKTFTILKALPQKKGILLLLKGIDNRNLAQNLVGSEIFMEKNQLLELEEDTWYWQDLIGLDVIDNTKGFIGRVKEIFPTKAHDILVVMDKEQETLVPMHKHFVESIDDIKIDEIKIDAIKKVIKVNLPEDF